MVGLLGLTTSPAAQGFPRPIGDAPLGGPSPALSLGAPAGTPGLVQGGCSSPGFPLFVLGPRTGVLVVR
jgi:hypothetical protein